MFKSLFGTSLNASLAHIWLFFLRIAVSAFMLTHGFPKFMKILEGNFKFADPYGIGSELSLFLAAFAEFFCSVLIILGFGTRLASIPLIVTMATAAFIAHANDPFAKKEMALLYLLIYATLFILGGGKYSADSFVRVKRR